MANGPLLSKFEHTAQDRAGNPIVGATVTVRRQGATVVSGGPTSFTVDDVGGIVAGDSCNIYNSDGTDPASATRSVTSITATNVTVGAPGFLSVTNNQRISPSSSPTTLFLDANGDEIGAVSLSTDANGYCSAWVFANVYDVVRTGGTSPLGTAQTQAWFDVAPNAVGGWRQVNTFISGTSVTDRIDIQRTGVSGHKFISYHIPGPDTEVWYLGLTTANALIVPGHHIAGQLVIESGGLSVQSGISAVQALTATTGSFSGLLTPAVGLSATTGNVDVLAATGLLRGCRTRYDRGTALSSADWAISAGWGTTATKFAAGSYGTDGAGQFLVTSSGTGQAANATCTLTFKDGAWPAAVAGVVIGSGSASPISPWVLQASGTTTITWLFSGVPVAASTYGFFYHHFLAN